MATTKASMPTIARNESPRVRGERNGIAHERGSPDLGLRANLDVLASDADGIFNPLGQVCLDVVVDGLAVGGRWIVCVYKH